MRCGGGRRACYWRRSQPNRSDGQIAPGRHRSLCICLSAVGRRSRLAVWERFVIAREAVGEVLAEPRGGRDVVPVVVAGERPMQVRQAVPGSVVPHWEEGLAPHQPSSGASSFPAARRGPRVSREPASHRITYDGPLHIAHVGRMLRSPVRPVRGIPEPVSETNTRQRRRVGRHRCRHGRLQHLGPPVARLASSPSSCAGGPAFMPRRPRDHPTKSTASNSRPPRSMEQQLPTPDQRKHNSTLGKTRHLRPSG